MEAAEADAFWALLAREPFLGGRIRTAWQCYREHPGQCGFYLADDTGALMVLGAGALLCGGADGAELGAFLRFAGVENFKSETVAPAGFARRPQLLMAHGPDGGAQMPWKAPDGLALEAQPDLWALAHAGLPGFPPADAYYADACLRRNRGLADIATFRFGGAYVASAGVYSLQPGAAYITAVATLPAWQGRGLAGALLRHLVGRCGGRTVYLLCRPALRGFYERQGFAFLREITECVGEDGQA